MILILCLQRSGGDPECSRCFVRALRAPSLRVWCCLKSAGCLEIEMGSAAGRDVESSRVHGWFLVPLMTVAFFWRRCYRSILGEQKAAVCALLSLGGAKSVRGLRGCVRGKRCIPLLIWARAAAPAQRWSPTADLCLCTPARCQDLLLSPLHDRLQGLRLRSLLSHVSL